VTRGGTRGRVRWSSGGRTRAINSNALSSLIPEGALVHRLTGVTLEGLHMLHRGMLEGARFEPFDAGLRRRGMHPEDLGDKLARFPFSEDGADFDAAVCSFVRESLESSLFAASLSTASVWWRAAPSRRSTPVYDRAHQRRTGCRAGLRRWPSTTSNERLLPRAAFAMSSARAGTVWSAPRAAPKISYGARWARCSARAKIPRCW